MGRFVSSNEFRDLSFIFPQHSALFESEAVFFFLVWCSRYAAPALVTLPKLCLLPMPHRTFDDSRTAASEHCAISDRCLVAHPQPGPPDSHVARHPIRCCTEPPRNKNPKHKDQTDGSGETCNRRTADGAGCAKVSFLRPLTFGATRGPCVVSSKSGLSFDPLLFNNRFACPPLTLALSPLRGEGT